MTMEVSVLYTNDDYSGQRHPVTPSNPVYENGAMGDNLRIRFRSYDVGVDLIFTKETMTKFLKPDDSWNSMKYSVQTEVWKRDNDDTTLRDKDGEQIVTWSAMCVTDSPDYNYGQVTSLKVGLLGPLLDLVNSSAGAATLRRCMRFADA